MNPQSLNRYAYVMNNPTNMIDPLGLEGEDACALYFHLPPGTRCDMWFTGPGGQGFNTPGGMFNTDPFDRCAYITTVDASCGQAPGLWPDGTPIYGGGSGVSISGTIGGWGGITGWNPNSPPIYLPPPSAGSRWCGDFTGCIEPAPTFFAPQTLLLPPASIGGAATSALMFGTTVILAGYLAYSNKDAIKHIVADLDNIRREIGNLNASPAGPGGPRNHWRTEIRAWLKDARKWGNRMSRGKAKDYWNRMIDQAERMVPQD